MPAFDRLSGVEVDAERRAEQRLLHVVDRQRVAGEQDVDEAAANRAPENAATRRCARRPGRRRPRCGRRAAFDLAHHRRDARDADLDAPLGRDLVGHEREAVAVAFLELGNHAHAGDAADDVIAGADVAQLPAAAHAPARPR